MIKIDELSSATWDIHLILAWKTYLVFVIRVHIRLRIQPSEKLDSRPSGVNEKDWQLPAIYSGLATRDRLYYDHSRPLCRGSNRNI